MKVQRGRHVRLSTGKLIWETYYEDKGPSRARQVSAKNFGGHPHSVHRRHNPPSGFSLTEPPHEALDPAMRALEAAVTELEIVPSGKSGSTSKKMRRKAA